MTKPLLEWVILATGNYQKSRQFYKDILRLKIVREVIEEEFSQFKLQNCFLAIYGRKYLKKLVGEKYIKPPGGAIYAFAESKDVDSDYKILKQKGVSFIKKPKIQPWGQKTAYFKDPDGHIWEIQQWLKNEPRKTNRKRSF